MLHHAYRFPSRADALAALATAPAWAELDLIGRAYAPASASPDGVALPGAALPGWHVNAIWPEAEPEGWAYARISPADAPRWWSGVARVAVPDPPSVDEYQRAVEAHVEAVVATKGYRSAESCAGYVTSTIPLWAAQAAAFIRWRDQVWTAVFARQAAVQNGAPVPTIAELVASLPVIVWPT